MTEPVVELFTNGDEHFAKVTFEGKLYVFHREDGDIQLYAWEEETFFGRKKRRHVLPDKKLVSFLAPFAEEALRNRALRARPRVVERPRYADTDLLDPATRIFSPATP